jgi:hypothetical protein
MDITSIINKAFAVETLTRKVEINGLTFVLGAASNKDETTIAELFNKAQKTPEDSMSYLGDVRARSIASVLRSINGEVIPDIVELPDGTKVERIVYLAKEISKWPASLVATLFTVTNDFNKMVKNNLRKTVKYEWYGPNIVELEQKEAEEENRADKEELEKIDLKPLVVTDTPA